MKKTGVFLAEGFEEIEGLTVVDILRRAGIEVVTISIMGKKEVYGSHNIGVLADTLFEEVDFEEYEGVVLPGGMPGTTNLGSHPGVADVVKSFAKNGKLARRLAFWGKLASWRGKRLHVIQGLKISWMGRRQCMKKWQKTGISLPAGAWGPPYLSG